MNGRKWRKRTGERKLVQCTCMYCDSVIPDVCACTVRMCFCIVFPFAPIEVQGNTLTLPSFSDEWGPLR